MLNDIYEVTQDTLNYLYKFNINTGGNILIFGPSGIGKTEMALQAAKNIGYEAIYVNLSTLESPDLVGIPKEVNGVTTHAPVEFLPLRNSNKKPVVLIVDELDKAADELQNPMLELFQFRSINGKPLNIQAIIATELFLGLSLIVVRFLKLNLILNHGDAGLLIMKLIHL